MTIDLNSPVRNLRPNRSRRVIYQFPSAKNSKALKVEEWIELHFCYLMEYDKTVISYKPQPIRFSTTENNKPRAYVPDFEVTYANLKGPPFFECKPQSHMEIYHKKRQLFLPQIEALGGRLEVWTDNDARSHRVSNLKLIYPYSLLPTNPQQEAILLTILRDTGQEVTLGELVELSGLGSAARNIIYSLMFHGKIEFLIDFPLSEKSKIAIYPPDVQVRL